MNNIYTLDIAVEPWEYEQTYTTEETEAETWHSEDVNAGEYITEMGKEPAVPVNNAVIPITAALVIVAAVVAAVLIKLTRTKEAVHADNT